MKAFDSTLEKPSSSVLALMKLDNPQRR